ncbi:hypothetical protein Tco_0153005 [Tanacetum coccineum]
MDPKYKEDLTNYELLRILRQVFPDFMISNEKYIQQVDSKSCGYYVMRWMQILASGDDVDVDDRALSLAQLEQITIDCINLCGYRYGDKPEEIMGEDQRVGVEKPMETLEAKKKKLRKNKSKKTELALSDIPAPKSTPRDEEGNPFQACSIDDMDHNTFNKLRDKTKRTLSTLDIPPRVWQAFGQVQPITKRICAEPQVFGTAKEYLILVPPRERMQFFTGGRLEVCTLEWFAMSLKKWAAENGHEECRVFPKIVIHNDTYNQQVDGSACGYYVMRWMKVLASGEVRRVGLKWGLLYNESLMVEACPVSGWVDP